MKIEMIKFNGYRCPPKRQFDNDAGADVYLNESYGILPHHTIRIPLGFGLLGMWVGFALDENIRGVVLMRRWHSKRWTGKNFAV